MTPWRAYALTSFLTATAMAALVGLRYAGAERQPAPAFAAADPVTTGTIARRPAAEAPARPRRFPPSAFAAGEIAVPPPRVGTVGLSFRKAGEAAPGEPVAGLFTAAADEPGTGVQARPAARVEDRVLARVEVVDGVSFTAGGRRIRLAGIALPAAGRACPMLDGTPETCRNRARTQLELFLRHRPVTCALPPGRGETVARCRVGTADIGEWLVRGGWAEPAAEADARLAAAAAEARRRRVGLWRPAG